MSTDAAILALLFFHLGHFFFVLARLLHKQGGALGVHQGGVMLVTALCCCMWGRGQGGAMAPAPLSPPDFSHSLCYPQSNWAPLVLVSEWVGLCTL